MKRLRSLGFAFLVLGGVALASSGCVVAGGRISGGMGVYYGPYHGWFYDGAWLNGWPWWRGGVYLQPAPIHFRGPHSWPHIPDRPRVHRRP
jgi:hypothetical protein